MVVRNVMERKRVLIYEAFTSNVSPKRTMQNK